MAHNLKGVFSVIFFILYCFYSGITIHVVAQEIGDNQQDNVNGVESGPEVVTQQFGEWLLECYDPAINAVHCQVKQRIVHVDTQKNILVMSIAYNPDEKVHAIQYILPLDFLLTPGVSVEVGDYQVVAGVNRCSVQGCYIEGIAEDELIKAIKESRKDGRVVLVSRTNQKMAINFSALGFTQAYNKMHMMNEKYIEKNKPVENQQKVSE